MSITDILVTLVAGDLRPEDGRVLRRAGFTIFWRFGFVMFVVFSMGWLGIIGLVGFARADDVDRKITASVTPINVQLTQLTRSVSDQGIAAREQTLQSLRTAIVDAQVKKCRSGKAETAAIYRELVMTAQERYYVLAQQSYPVPPCADL